MCTGQCHAHTWTFLVDNGLDAHRPGFAVARTASRNGAAADILFEVSVPFVEVMRSDSVWINSGWPRAVAPHGPDLVVLEV